MSVVVKKREVECFWSHFYLSPLLKFAIHCEFYRALKETHIKNLVLEFFIPYMENFGSQIFPEEGSWRICFNSVLPLKLYFSNQISGGSCFAVK